MTSFFVPYSGKKPKALSINGHRLILLVRERGSLDDHLAELGADNVRRVRGGASQEEDHVVITRLARTAKAGVVVAPNEVGVREVIRDLEATLPWLQ